MHHTQDPATIFVVDGDAEARSNLLWLLRHTGEEVRPFAGPTEFLEAFEPGAPGCIVAESRLPQVSGIELLRRLRREGNVTPIVFHSAYGDVATTAEAFREGAFHFLPKDSPSQKLLDAVQEALHFDAEVRCLYQRAEQFAERMRLLSQGELEVVNCLVDDLSWASPESCTSRYERIVMV